MDPSGKGDDVFNPLSLDEVSSLDEEVRTTFTRSHHQSPQQSTGAQAHQTPGGFNPHGEGRQQTTMGNITAYLDRYLVRLETTRPTKIRKKWVQPIRDLRATLSNYPPDVVVSSSFLGGLTPTEIHRVMEEVMATHLEAGQKKSKLKGKSIFTVGPFPMDMETFNSDGMYSEEFIRHFEGACLRCGLLNHVSSECRKYELFGKFCETCRQGFHDTCRHPYYRKPKAETTTNKVNGKSKQKAQPTPKKKAKKSKNLNPKVSKIMKEKSKKVSMLDSGTQTTGDIQGTDGLKGKMSSCSTQTAEVIQVADGLTSDMCSRFTQTTVIQVTDAATVSDKHQNVLPGKMVSRFTQTFIQGTATPAVLDVMEFPKRGKKKGYKGELQNKEMQQNNRFRAYEPPLLVRDLKEVVIQFLFCLLFTCLCSVTFSEHTVFGPLTPLITSAFTVAFTNMDAAEMAAEMTVYMNNILERLKNIVISKLRNLLHRLEN